MFNWSRELKKAEVEEDKRYKEFTKEPKSLEKRFYVSNKKEVREVHTFIKGEFARDGESLVSRQGGYTTVRGNCYVYVLSMKPGYLRVNPASLTEDSKVEFIPQNTLFETEREAQLELMIIERFEKKVNK